MFAVNVTGAFMTAQAAAKAMITHDTPGSIVFIASMSGTVANRGLICPAYNASKAGVLQLARNLASEWGEYGIRVNTISPGYIVTAMVEELFQRFPERREDWPTQNMLGRLSRPEEYRGAAVFLVSDASSFMTGADLVSPRSSLDPLSLIEPGMSLRGWQIPSRLLTLCLQRMDGGHAAW